MVIAVVYVIAIAVDSKKRGERSPLLNSFAIVFSFVNTAASTRDPKDIVNTIATKYLMYARFCRNNGNRK